MSELEHWIWFASLKMLKNETRLRLLEQFGGAGGVYLADPDALRGLDWLTPRELDGVLDRDLSAASAVLRRCEDLNVQLVTLQDAAYPARLRNIPAPPAVLYVLGRLPAVDSLPVVTVVGTRRCSPFGARMARQLAYEVARRGAVVCTGLAEGVDSRAAEGALMAGGTVIGVLGTAINEIYPRWNERLFADVRAAGAIVSEYPPDARGSRSYFPARNRIMAGLCAACVVAEAPLRSGALITAHLALDYGRDVYAVPCNADAPDGQGCLALLREGASVAVNGWDIMRAFEGRFPLRDATEDGIPTEAALPARNIQAEAEGRRERRQKRAAHAPGIPASGEKADAPAAARTPEGAAADPRSVPAAADAHPGSGLADGASPSGSAAPRRRAREVLTDQLYALTEKQLRIAAVMEYPGMHIDDIVDRCGLPAPEVLSELTMLQIKGYAVQEPGKRFSLKTRRIT